jgi:hypothetical protein
MDMAIQSLKSKFLVVLVLVIEKIKSRMRDGNEDGGL